MDRIRTKSGAAKDEIVQRVSGIDEEKIYDHGLCKERHEDVRFNSRRRRLRWRRMFCSSDLCRKQLTKVRDTQGC